MTSSSDQQPPPGLRGEPAAFEGTERYVVRRKLGKGGMGVVYHAWDTERQMDVALKVLLNLDADGIYRLKNEFRSLADVSHPNLASLYELHSEEDQWFFTMELIEGADFHSWVVGDQRPEASRATLPTMSVRDALGSGRQAAPADDAGTEDLPSLGVAQGAPPPRSGTAVRASGSAPMEDTGSYPDELLAAQTAAMAMRPPTFAEAEAEALAAERGARVASDSVQAIHSAIQRLAPALPAKPVRAEQHESAEQHDRAIDEAPTVPLDEARPSQRHPTSEAMRRAAKISGGTLTTAETLAATPEDMAMARVAAGYARSTADDPVSVDDATVALEDDEAAALGDDASSEPTLAATPELLAAGPQAPVAARHNAPPPSQTRPGRRRVADWQRLRRALGGLARGVNAIHAAGKLHCDIKPSNALVDASGRVALLDFGLVSEGTGRKRDTVTGQMISGTPAYMAPEQARVGGALAASDWYAVGIMLYQAIVGQLPYRGSWLDILQAKGKSAPEPPHHIVPDAPRDLSDLCWRLLQPRPAARPGPAEIFAVLGVDDEVPAGVTLNMAEPPFLGREGTLGRLLGAWRMARSGKGSVVHLCGEAGIGKTALARRLLDEVESASGIAPVVLAGHCHERESLPYKAIDPLIDDLTTFLLHLDRRNGSPAYPTDIGALARLFPVLNRIPAIEQADRTALEALDVRAVRRLAFQALRALLLDLAERRPVVLLLDDLQWSDVDSVELIAALLEPPAVPALVLLMYRPDAGEGTAQHEALAALHPQDETMRADRRGRFLEFDPRLSFDDLELGPLDSGTIEEMAGHLLGDRVRRPTLVGAAPDDPRQETPAASIAREADGSPLFAIELARYHAEQRALGVPVAARVSLDEVLRMRLSRLSDGSRALLELISLAGKPTPLGVIHGAAQLGAVERPALARLRASYFVRTSGDSSLDHVDTLHNRIRDVVLDGLGPSRRRAHHAALAESLERQSATAPDVDALATHFLGAGDDTRALPWALKAAERAAAAYAHHDAIGHFDAALRILEAQADAATGTPDEDEAWRAVDAVRRDAAESARQAGAYGRAHVLLEQCLRRAERSTGPSGRIAQADLHASLGQVSQERGDAEGAIVRLETALRMYGRPPPANLFVLGLETAWQLLRHLTTRLEGEPQREIDPTLQKQADTLFGLIRIYYFVDIAKVTWAGLRVVNLARRLPRAGDRALAWSFYGVLLFGTGLLGQSRALCERALILARSSASPVSEAVILLRLGTQAMFANDLDRATAVLDESITKFKSIGEMWELQTALMIAATTRFIRGELTAAEPIYEEMGGYGRQLNAIMHQAWALAWAPFSRYLRGVQQAEQTRVDIERAIELSASASDLANTVASLMHLCSLEVREGRVEASASIAVRAHGAVSRYLVGVPFLQRCWIDAAEAALFALEQGARNEPRGKLLAIARQAVRRTRLLARFYPYLRGPSLYVRARLTAHTRGAAAAEPIYDRAIGALEGTPHRWELGVVLLDAARVLPHRRAELASRARQSFEAMGAHREVARVERLYDSD